MTQSLIRVHFSLSYSIILVVINSVISIHHDDYYNITSYCFFHIGKFCSCCVLEMKGLMTHKGVPDYRKSATRILKDFVNVKCCSPSIT